MKVLVTGHTGLIGTSLLKTLQNEYAVVTSYKRSQQRIDVLERAKLFEIDDVEAIIHLASKTSVPNSVLNPYETYFTNIIGTLNILDYAVNKNIKNIINLSTYLYGTPEYLPIDENHPVRPHSPYGKSKLISENLCKNYYEDHGLNIIILRPFYVYGPSSNSSFIPLILRKVFQNEKITLSGKNTRRDFLYVEDFSNLILKILKNFPKGYNLFNVGFGKSYTLENIIETVASITKREIEIQYNFSARPNDIVEMAADISKVRNKFNWIPTTDIRKGIQATIDEYLNG